MKKSRIIIIISVAVLLLALCYSYYKFEYNEITDTYDWNTFSTVPGIFMSEVSLADKRLAFTLINETDETIYYGEYITLEKHKNGKWYEIPLSGKVGFVDILNYLSPHSEDKGSYTIEAWENISTGKYRFIKEFYLDDKLKDPKYIFKEFEL